MARLSRLLSAVSLGIAATAALAVTASTEYASVRRSPTHRVESASEARVIVKFKADTTNRTSIASVAATTASGPQKASLLGSRLGLSLTDGRILGERTQVLKSSGMSSSALVQAIGADPEVEW